MDKFIKNLLEWYTLNKRTYPWRIKNKPYNVMISEILLHKTNSEKVKDVYKEFIDSFPNLVCLKEAEEEDICEIIKDLGLHYRVKRLKKIANDLTKTNDGKIPDSQEKLKTLTGIGRYISNAILCFGYGKKLPIVDTNVIRIYRRVFNLKSNKNRPRTDDKIWDFAEEMLPEENYINFNYALLDFAADTCTKNNPKCIECPLKEICYHYENEVETNESEITRTHAKS